MDIILNEDEKTLLSWLHEHAKGYQSEHPLWGSGSENSFQGQMKWDRDRYFKAVDYLVHFKFVKAPSGGQQQMLILTPDGENFYRLLEREEREASIRSMKAFNS